MRYRFSKLSIGLIERGDGFGMVYLFEKWLDDKDPYDGIIGWEEVRPYVEDVIVTRDMRLVTPEEAVEEVVERIRLRPSIRIRIDRERFN